MIWLKILLQVAVGVSAFLTVFLDYKWYDKRKKDFKKGRKWLLSFTALAAIASVVVTYLDDIEQRKEREMQHEEINSLSQEISSLQDSLSSVKQIGIKLDRQIEPFIKLATEKYPNLPIEEALKKVESKIEELQQKEADRRNREIRLNQLKNTPPDFDIGLQFVENELKLLIIKGNNIPIKFTFQVYGVNSSLKLSHIWLSDLDFIPSDDYGGKRYKVESIDKLPATIHISGDKNEEIVVAVDYESVYFADVPKPELRGVKKKHFIINNKERKVKAK